MTEAIENTFDSKVFQNERKHEKGYREWTFRRRTPPTFFIAGAQKAGTTSLYQFMVENKYVNQTEEKEIYFFNNLENYRKGERWYRAWFPLSSRRPTCDATANYFESAEAPERIRTHYPNAKIIILLRNPVERAFSHYKMAKKYGFEKLSFEDALQREDERLTYEKEQRPEEHTYLYQRLGYRTKGMYSEQLKYWLTTFPKEQLHIVISEELFANPEKECRKVLDFLNFDTHPKVPLRQANAGSHEDMPETVRRELLEFYAPYNAELSEMLNKELNWK